MLARKTSAALFASDLDDSSDDDEEDDQDRWTNVNNDDHEGYAGNKLKPQRSDNPSPIKHDRPLSVSTFISRTWWCAHNVQMGFTKNVILNILNFEIF